MHILGTQILEKEVKRIGEGERGKEGKNENIQENKFSCTIKSTGTQIIEQI